MTVTTWEGMVLGAELGAAGGPLGAALCAVIGGIVGTGISLGGAWLVSQMTKADTEASKSLSANKADACSTCQPPKCKDIVEGMRDKNAKLKHELNKYDPASDAKGGHPYAGPGGVTKYTRPGGHYQEIRDLQRGLNNSLESYNAERCYKGASAADKITTEAAQKNVNRPIEVPPGHSFIPL